MFPEDAVLVVYVPTMTDLDILRHEGWYRLPVHHAPSGLLAPIYAFYCGAACGALGHAIHYYARRHGHELVTRQMLFPDQSTHPRALEVYYKLQFGPLRRLRRPIVNPRWRRLLFAHATWDRLQRARVIGDLFATDPALVARRRAFLREPDASRSASYRRG